MNSFEACIDPADYFSKLKQLGYDSRRNGGAPLNKTFQDVRILEVTVVRGPGLSPCLLVSWLKTSDRETTYLSHRRFDNETALNRWLQQHGVTLSRHARKL